MEVDRFVYIDTLPFNCPHTNSPDSDIAELSPWYPSVDHFIKFWEVYLRTRMSVKSFRNHITRSYFEVEFSHRNVKFEYHYCTDFLNPRIWAQKMIQKANIVYQQGWLPEVSINLYFSSFHRADTIIAQESDVGLFAELSGRITLMTHPSYVVSIWK